ncbi:MAG TPA: Ig-like domain-containing protein [Rhodothermales bacterium]|nr:Ig-like domain-containing protein [Rhodothermales bacterium]
MSRSRCFIVLLIVFAALSQSACAPPECDPNSPQYDPDDCSNLLGDLIAYFTWLAYGTPPPPPGPNNTCPEPVVCFRPDCLLIHENGSFEVDGDNRPVLWYGDEAGQTIVPTCHEGNALEFEATTPNGPSVSASAQVYQVIDYATLLDDLPDGMWGTTQRVRAWAAFGIFLPGDDDDRQFGLRIDAYAGSGFPLNGDPETIPTQTGTYQRLATAEATLMYNINGPEWQPLETALMVPENTDFLVIFLEAVEDVENDEQFEFSNHAVDYVHITLDGGNTPPVAHADQRRVPENTPTTVFVLANDRDNTSLLDKSSVTIRQPPGQGDATVEGNGRIRYTPNSDFLGTDTFTYTVADVEGLVSNEALVTVTVFNVNEAPVAADDAYEISDGGLLIVPAPIGVLANDTDPDGDALTAELVQDVNAGTLNLDPTGAFTYTPPNDFAGSTTFTYRATDGAAFSDEATVTLTGGSGYDLALTKTANPTQVTPSGEATFTITVTNNGPASATGIEVTDQVPDFETTIQSTQTSQGAYNQNAGLWTVGDLATGETATLTITALIHLNVTNTATITDGLDEDSNANNDSDDATVTIVDQPNQSPVANDDSGTTTPGITVQISLLDNDFDPDGSLNGNNVEVINEPANGSFFIGQGGFLLYNPEPDFEGIDTLTYTVEDNDGAVSNVATVTITVG